MSEQVIGPIMADIEGLSLTAIDREILSHPLVGAVLLFTRNYENRQQLSSLIKDIRALNKAMLIAVDHEGGRVQRFREGFSRLPAVGLFANQYATDSALAMQQAKQSGFLMAKELIEMDIDFSFAPVLDLDYGHSEIIGDRSFGRESQQVISLAGAYISGMHQAGMAATGKHFPGHGFVSADSHLALPVDHREFSEIKANDLQPFIQLLHNLQAIMPAHIVYEQVDSLPAGFSRQWLQGILRNELQFDGAIISDDLNMAGAHVIGDMVARFDAAMAAGCDMAIIANNREGVTQVLDQTTYVPTLYNYQRLRIMAKHTRDRFKL